MNSEDHRMLSKFIFEALAPKDAFCTGVQTYRELDDSIIKCETTLGYHINNRYEFVTFAGQRIAAGCML